MYRTFHKQRREQALDLVLSLKKTLRDSGRPSDEYVFVFPWGNFGEHTYILALLHHLRARHKICLVVKESKLWMANYFPASADFVIHIPDVYHDLYDELFDLSYLAPGCPYVVNTDVIANGRFNTELVRQGRITLMESYAFALELALDAPPNAMSVAHRGAELQEQRRTLARRGKGQVLLMPSANTIKNLVPEFWIALYVHLAREGFDPVLDTTFSHWQIEGANTVQLKQDALVDYVVRDCRAVVGLRSGILDLLGGLARDSDLKIAAVYPIESDTYSPDVTGLNVKGVATGGIAIGRCWNTDHVLDIETPLHFDAAGFGAQLVDFLR